MTHSTDSRIEQLRQWRQDLEETWQLAIARMPMWVEGDPDHEPFRPWLPLCVSCTSKYAGAGDAEPSPDHDGALDALVSMAGGDGRHGVLPGRLDVRDPELGRFLREQLVGLDIEVVERDELADVDHVLRVMMERECSPADRTSLLESTGGNVDRIRSFAEAAAAFFEARPWLHLNSYDLIEVESDRPSDDMRLFTVLGALGQQFGIGFHPNRRFWERTLAGERPTGGVVWMVTFDDLCDLPIPDADLWLDHDLPTAESRVYPLALGFDLSQDEPIPLRPDAASLAYLESLLRALTAATEPELDRGRWTQRVHTYDGERNVTLALPCVLDPPERWPDHDQDYPDRRLMERSLRALRRLVDKQEFDTVDEMNAFLQSQTGKRAPELPIESDADRALHCFYRALETQGRMQIRLAREALEFDPDCADAYVLIAERAPDRERASELYRQGVEAGRRALSPELVEEHPGELWPVVEARGYLRALMGVGETLSETDDLDGAIESYRELLRLDAGDHQGARPELLRCLLETDRNDEAGLLLADECDLDATVYAWANVLLGLRTHQSDDVTTERLEHALSVNRFVPRFLLGQSKPPPRVPRPRLGNEDDAAIWALQIEDAWEDTPGAMQWLEGTMLERKLRRKNARKQRGKPAGRRKSKRGRG